MSFLEPLLAYIAKHLVVTAAIGGLTVAGAAVTVDQVVASEAPAAALSEGTDPGEPAANDVEPADPDPLAAGAAGEATSTGAGEKARAGDDEDAGDDAETNDLDDETVTARGQSDAVHAVIRGGDVEPGSRDFGQAVAEAASQGRSAQRGRSAEAPGKQAKSSTPDDGDGAATDPDPESAVTPPASEDTQTTQTTPNGRGPAQDRRPAPGDEADASDPDATSGPGKSSARGRR